MKFRRSSSRTEDLESNIETTDFTRIMGSNSESGVGHTPNEALILSLDIGTTSVRCHVYDRRGHIRGEGSRQIVVEHPKPGWSEMDENLLWQQVQEVGRDAIADAGVTATDIACMGITTQRNTFITWDRETGKPFHRFITWQDLRARDLVKSWNDSYLMKAFNNGSKALYFMTRKKRYLAASVLRFKSSQIVMRLKWVLNNIPELAKRVEEKQVMFGCIETWLLWKLTGGAVHVTDYSCASPTAFYDPFSLEWSGIVSGLLSLPMHILPEVKDTSGHFGDCEEEIYGARIPITSVVADQQSAMFGQCCFNLGDVNATLGTGTFIDTNTGNKPHASIAGLYPLIGWKIGQEVTYLAEGHASDTGTCVEWAKQLGFFEDISELESVIKSVPDSGGVYFIPAFSGLQAPVMDDKACTGLIGLTPDTKKAHIMRAVMESLSFRFKMLHDTVLNETRTPLSSLCRVDGGVSNSDFVMQLVSDLIDRDIERREHTDMTSLGAAFLAGLAVGIWKDKYELKKLQTNSKIFHPGKDAGEKYSVQLVQWREAMKRCQGWYKQGHD